MTIDEQKMADELTSRVQPVLDHILQIWCRNEQSTYEYVLNWMAHAVQKPWEKMACALVLRGAEGAGKGCIVDLLARVLGKEYYYQVKDADNGLFAKHAPQGMENCLLLFVDEAVWGGNKKEAGILKKLITEDTHEIEPKFLIRFTVDSFFNLIFASNNDWVVPAGLQARRFLSRPEQCPCWKVPPGVFYCSSCCDRSRLGGVSIFQGYICFQPKTSTCDRLSA